MSADHVELRRGAYHDSVTLMQASRAVADVDGVEAAIAAMATELNLDLARGMGFDVPAGTGPNDLLVALRAASEETLAAGLAALTAALAPRTGSSGAGTGEQAAPRTTGAAVRRADADLVLVSVPGRAAFVEAMDALEAGAHVMVFSDNVPVEQEVRLKEEAGRRGLLVMGPDCGTAVVSGVGLGFANVVQPGPVSLVAASGTGAQQLLCLLDAGGVGVRHCLGVGGRDLSTAVGARSTLQALQMLDADPGTELIVVVSKPPADEVADAVRAAASSLATPVILALLGRDADDLTAAASAACAALGRELELPVPVAAPAAGDASGMRGPALRGLFSGGTLCDEAMVIAARELGPVRSNIPLEPEWALGPDLRADGHLMIDFGDDELTQGRPHPMIDQGLRVARLRAEGDDPATGVVLLDLVLGHGAHADPAAELAPAITQARAAAARDGRDLAVVVSLCGTVGDPQGLEKQGAALVAAGALVHRSNADAARAAVALVKEAQP